MQRRTRTKVDDRWWLRQWPWCLCVTEGEICNGRALTAAHPLLLTGQRTPNSFPYRMRRPTHPLRAFRLSLWSYNFHDGFAFRTCLKGADSAADMDAVCGRRSFFFFPVRAGSLEYFALLHTVGYGLRCFSTGYARQPSISPTSEFGVLVAGWKEGELPVRSPQHPRSLPLHECGRPFPSGGAEALSP